MMRLVLVVSYDEVGAGIFLVSDKIQHVYTL